MADIMAQVGFILQNALDSVAGTIAAAVFVLVIYGAYFGLTYLGNR